MGHFGEKIAACAALSYLFLSAPTAYAKSEDTLVEQRSQDTLLEHGEKSKQEQAQTETREFNRLNWAESSEKEKFSIQFMLDFKYPVYCTYEVDKENHQLLLKFPGMSLQTFNAQHVLAKLVCLKQSGFVRNIEITEQSENVSTVILTIEFAPYRDVTNPQTKVVERIQNKLLIKWNTIENPNRLIVDIFIKDRLDQLKQKNASFLFTSNDLQKYDFDTQSQKDSTQPLRIVIDPGHGGTDCGTKGCRGLLEKNIALDVAKRLHTILKSKNYHALLTRNDDKDITLLERSQLAYQLKADLFVSVHVNSGGCHSDALGIETFYLNANELMPRKGKTGFLFINCSKDVNLINDLTERIKSNMNLSKALAQQIQGKVLALLASKNITTKNRGIKPEKFRTLLRADVPAALVEVGFLTNPQEAALLEKPAYRTLIAQGIFEGITSYLSNNR